MIIRIKEGKVPFVAPMLNGEPVIVELKKFSFLDDKLKIEIDVINESHFSSPDPFKGYLNGLSNIIEVPNIIIREARDPSNGNFIFDQSTGEFVMETLTDLLGEINSVTAIKEVYKSIKSAFGLSNSDLEIKSEYQWRHSDQVFRVFVPMASIIKKPEYNSLIDSLITSGVINYESGDGFILYLSYINQEDKDVLDADPNVIIENLN